MKQVAMKVLSSFLLQERNEQKLVANQTLMKKVRFVLTAEKVGASMIPTKLIQRVR